MYINSQKNCHQQVNTISGYCIVLLYCIMRPYTEDRMVITH